MEQKRSLWGDGVNIHGTYSGTQREEKKDLYYNSPDKRFSNFNQDL